MLLYFLLYGEYYNFKKTHKNTCKKIKSFKQIDGEMRLNCLNMLNVVLLGVFIPLKK